MEHGTIEARSLIERYHRGTLSAEEEERFEAHFMDCAQCQEELEAQRSFARGMKTLAAREAARSAVRAGLLAWLSRRAGAAAVAALVVIAAGIGFGHLLRENRRLETRLAELAQPMAEVPVALLGVLRSEDGSPTVVTDPGGPYALAIDAGADPRLDRFSVTIFDQAGEVRFERRDLAPNVLEVIQLTFPTGFLPPGEYRLLAEGTLPDGEKVEIADHDFRIVPGG